MRIQIDLRVGEHRRELLNAVRRAALRQLIGEVLGVIGRYPGIMILNHRFTQRTIHRLVFGVRAESVRKRWRSA